MTKEKQMEAKAIFGHPPLPDQAGASTLFQTSPVCSLPWNLTPESPEAEVVGFSHACVGSLCCPDLTGSPKTKVNR